jgi:ATP-dependent Clp protease ATP-binding subunit ClpC
MSGTTGRPSTITLARDAVVFIDQVEREARRHGSAELGLHHWVATACARTFLARTVARERDILATRARMQEALDAGTPGPPLPPENVLAEAKATAARRQDSRIHAWHLVLVVLRRFGIATRDTEPALDVEPSRDTEPALDVEPSRDTEPALEVEPGAPTQPATPTPAPEPTPEPAPATPEPAPATPGPAQARRSASRSKRPPTPMLDQCGSDWTQAATRGELPPMVERDTELRLVIEGLCRPTKPNVLLVGEPGVGKSALVEGLAQRIAAGDVPAPLRGRPLIALSMAELTRESRYYGVMEQRLASLIAEARAIHAILFIDEGHAMTGSGGREGTGDVASVFKPVLARGALSLISATTGDEYRRFIAPNGALERRFNVVHVAEPARDAVRAMLAAHRDAIAVTHRIMVGDAAIERLLVLTTSRLSHRREPDRSRDLLDQAVARAIAAGADAVTTTDLEATAAAASGAPEVTDETLAGLERSLVREGLLRDADATRLVDRLGLAFAGLTLRPERPRATVLVLRSAGGPDGLAVAEALATQVLGGPERVISIGVGGIRDPNAISGFLGTSQGYIGHGEALPIHGLAERPSSVLLLRGIDAAHEAFRSLLARALRDGYLTDAQARRIGLTSSIVVLEAAAQERIARPLGFGVAGAASREAGPASRDRALEGRPTDALAIAALGEELAAACDLTVLPPSGRGSGWLTHTLDQLASSYRAAGIELAWDPAAEAVLANGLAAASSRDRERAIETRVGRAVRSCLRAGRRPVRARVRGVEGRLVADIEA